MPATDRKIRTRHADIAIRETTGDKLPVLLIHGNSSCKEVFRAQLDSAMGKTYRMIALDLPGHGASSDAFNPEKTYTMPGYAEVAVEVLAALGVGKAVVYGWSLGGHVGIEMIPRFPGLVGLMITGTPPVKPTPEAIQMAFKPNPQIGLFGKPDLTPEEMEIAADMSYGAAADQTFRDALKRADGRSRALMFQSLFAGSISDQRALVENASIPVAVLNGADDPLVNTDYLETLSYKTLWEKHCYLLRGAGHAPFLTTPGAFNPIFERFLADMEKLARITSAPGRSGAAAA